MDVNDFFLKVREDSINRRFIASGATRDTAEVTAYIEELIALPFDAFLGYIKETTELPFVLSSDVPQFSSIDAAIDKICSLLSQLPPVGFSFEEIGKILQPGRTDDVLANKKYGENHVKTAESLGLAFSENRKYFLSAVGYVFPSLTKYQKDQLISRLALRNSLVYNVLYKVLNGHDVTITDEISFLSESTVKRRKNNSLIFCRLIGLNQDFQVQAFLERIK